MNETNELSIRIVVYDFNRRGEKIIQDIREFEPGHCADGKFNAFTQNEFDCALKLIAEGHFVDFVKTPE